ncbi:MAG: lanthionine synthetase [Oscillospiraceae bacterium]|jgi:lantibiotic modifying enzyme|nr:lanthionine synthetase [Oscillospiraceae bacterium]
MSESARALRPIFGPFDYVKSAEGVAAFLKSIAVQTESGIFWPAQPEIDTSEDAASFAYYNGNAGKIYFLTQLAAATGDKQYLAAAQDGARYILRNFATKTSAPLFHGLDDVEHSFYLGNGGIAFALLELYKLTKDEELYAFTKKLTDAIVETAIIDADGARWSKVGGLIGDWGTVLYLLYAAEIFGDDKYKDLAVLAGGTIIAGGEDAPIGKRYIAFTGSLGDFPETAFPEFPNFELGTAGGAYTLARLYEVSGEQRFLDAAKAGADYVQSLAITQGDAALIPYRLPDAQDVYYLGFCHGPAGTGRLYYKLHKLTGDAAYGDFLNKLVNGLLLAGAPDQHSNGYWKTYSQCCGTSAQINFFLGLWADTGDAKYLELANRGGRHVLGDAAVTDGPELKWYQAFERINPALITLDSGFSNGAAGIGAALLQLGLANEGRFTIPRQPDDPFPSKA